MSEYCHHNNTASHCMECIAEQLGFRKATKPQPQVPTDEQVEAAKKLIARDPDRAAYTLAEAQDRLAESEAALSAVRSFSQNPWMAKNASRKQIEAALGRQLE